MWSLFEFFDTVYRVNAEAKQAFQEIIREKAYSKNEIIQEIGSRCRTVYIVETGGARIFYLKDGNDITEHFAFENDLIVRAESLFTGNPTSKGIQAIDESRMLVIVNAFVGGMIGMERTIIPKRPRYFGACWRKAWPSYSFPRAVNEK